MSAGSMGGTGAWREERKARIFPHPSVPGAAVTSLSWPYLPASKPTLLPALPSVPQPRANFPLLLISGFPHYLLWLLRHFITCKTSSSTVSTSVTPELRVRPQRLRSEARAGRTKCSRHEEHPSRDSREQTRLLTNPCGLRRERERSHMVSLEKARHGSVGRQG